MDRKSKIRAFLYNVNGLFIRLDLNVPSQSTVLTPAHTKWVTERRQPGHLTVKIWVGFLSFLRLSLFMCRPAVLLLISFGKEQQWAHFSES